MDWPIIFVNIFIGIILGLSIIYIIDAKIKIKNLLWFIVLTNVIHIFCQAIDYKLNNFAIILGLTIVYIIKIKFYFKMSVNKEKRPN